MHRRAGIVNISWSLTALTPPSYRSWSPGSWNRAGRQDAYRHNRTDCTAQEEAAVPQGERQRRTPCRSGLQEGAPHYGKQGRYTSSRPVFLPWRLPNQPLDARMKALKLLRPGVSGAVVDAGISLSERPGKEKAHRLSLIDDGNGFFQVNPSDSMLLHQFMHCLWSGLAAVSRAVLTRIFTSAPARALGTAVMPMALIAVENFTAHGLPPPSNPSFYNTVIIVGVSRTEHHTIRDCLADALQAVGHSDQVRWAHHIPEAGHIFPGIIRRAGINTNQRHSCIGPNAAPPKTVQNFVIPFHAAPPLPYAR